MRSEAPGRPRAGDLAPTSPRRCTTSERPRRGSLRATHSVERGPASHVSRRVEGRRQDACAGSEAGLRESSSVDLTRLSLVNCETVSAEEVDEYLRSVDEPKRSTLQTLRRTILEIVPDAEQVISYRVPAFRVSGKTIAGFAAFKDHLSYLPFSGSVLGQLADELKGYTMTKSSLHFPAESATEVSRAEADRSASRGAPGSLPVVTTPTFRAERRRPVGRLVARARCRAGLSGRSSLAIAIHRPAAAPRLKRPRLRGCCFGPPAVARCLVLGPPSKCLQLRRVRLTRSASPGSIRPPTSTPSQSPRSPRLATSRS